jgi:uncharacterized RDD family membrane protein YckC
MGGMPPSYGGNPYGDMPTGPSSNYAGFGTRFVAILIDGLISFGFQLPGILIQQGSAPLGALLQLVGVVAFVFLWSKQIGETGQSWGKKAMNIRVVDAQTGGTIGQGRAVGRYFAQIISAIPCYLGFLWPLWDQKKQTFHDKILGTYVVAA